MEKNGNFLESLLEDLGITVARISKDLKVDPKTIWNWTHREGLPDGEAPAKLSDYLAIPLNLLRKAASGEIELPPEYRERANWHMRRKLGMNAHPVTEATTMPPIYQPPIVGRITAGGMVEMFEDGGELERVLISMPEHPNAYALRIVGDSMSPDFLNGDVIVCEPIDMTNIQPGDDVVIWCSGDNDSLSTFKRVEKIVKGVIYLRPLNSKYKMVTCKCEHVIRAGLQFKLIRDKRRA